MLGKLRPSVEEMVHLTYSIRKQMVTLSPIAIATVNLGSMQVRMCVNKYLKVSSNVVNKVRVRARVKVSRFFVEMLLIVFRASTDGLSK